MTKNKIGAYLDASDNMPKKPGFIEEWIWASDINRFKGIISNFFERNASLPEIISINHDLTTEHISLELRRPVGKKIEYEMFPSDTGLHAAIWLRDFCISNKIFLNRVVVHGPNNDGNNHIINAINKYYKMCGQDLVAYKQNWEYEK